MLHCLEVKDLEIIPCEVVKDLLPLYHDDVCNERTKELVKNHLDSCFSCKQEFVSMRNLLSKEELSINHNINTLKIVLDTWNALLKKSFFKGMLLMSGIVFIITVSYLFLFSWNTQEVASSNFEVYDINRLENGKIVYYVNIKDHYHITKVVQKLDQDGNFYLIPKRSIVKKEASILQIGEGYNILDKSSLENYYDKNIKAIYYGTPNDAILIWKEGMELHLANKELEAYFSRKLEE